MKYNNISAIIDADIGFTIGTLYLQRDNLLPKYVRLACFSVFIIAVTRFPAYEACVCIAANCHCGSGSGDPHVTSMLDKRTVTCGCAGERTYVDNQYVNVRAVNTRISRTSDVTVYTQVSEPKDSNRAPWGSQVLALASSTGLLFPNLGALIVGTVLETHSTALACLYYLVSKMEHSF